jgi:hypothetical protein
MSNEDELDERDERDERKAYLEFTWEKNGVNKWSVKYELVIPLARLDIRNNKENGEVNDAQGEKRVLLGETECEGSGPITLHAPDQVRTPYRDGVHAHFDSKRMGGLDIWAKYGTMRTLIKKAIEFNTVSQKLVIKMPNGKYVETLTRDTENVLDALDFSKDTDTFFQQYKQLGGKLIGVTVQVSEVE